ncbi:hypothetical protein D3C76_1322610 [compost metagenome]
MRHALINQAGFFFTADHLYRAAEDRLRGSNKLSGIHRQTQGCGGDNTDLLGGNILQAFGKETQALPAALHGFRREMIIRTQARRETDLALNTRQRLYTSRHLAYNQHMKTIRT